MKGLTISTFGVGSMNTTAASAVLALIEQNQLMENAITQGDELRQRLVALQERHPIIGDIRSLGLMQAVELVTDQILEACHEEGLLLGKGGLHGNAFSITPLFLNIIRADVDEFATKFGRTQERESSS